MTKYRPGSRPATSICLTPEQVQRVGMLLQRPPLTDGCKLVIDETGVGRAVGDIFDAAGLRPNRVTITAGQEATQQVGAHDDLILAVAIALWFSTNMPTSSSEELLF